MKILTKSVCVYVYVGGGGGGVRVLLILDTGSKPQAKGTLIQSFLIHPKQTFRSKKLFNNGLK